LIGEYALGSIAPGDRARLERHLAACGACRRALEETQRLYGLLRPFELARPTAAFAARLDAALKHQLVAGDEALLTPAPDIPTAAPSAPAAGEPTPARRPWRRWPVFAAAFGTAAAAATLAALYFKVGMFAPAPEKVPSPAGVTTKAPAPGWGAGGHERPPVAAREKGAKAGAEAPAPTTFTGETAAPVVLEKKSLAATEDTKVSETRDDALARLAGSEERTEAGAREGELAYRAGGGKAAGEGLAGAGGLGLAPSSPGADAGVASKMFAAAPATLADELDPRIAADVERLTASDGVLLDYVMPNGGVMAYFYELSPEEQWTVLSRLKEEAAREKAEEIFLSP